MSADDSIDHHPPQLLLEVHLEDGRTHRLKICESDDPMELSRRFASEFNVKEEMIPMLAHEIRKN